MIEHFDKRALNLIVIIALTFITFSWTFWIFHQPFNIYAVLVVALSRILASVLILKDYSLSWSKASQKTFILKSFVYFVPLLFYIAPFYTIIRIALFVSEFAFFLLSINFLMYSYHWYINRSKIKPSKSLIIYGAGSGGVKLLEEYRKSKYKVYYFVDDNPSLQNRSIDGVKIVSSTFLQNCFQGEKYDLMVLSMPSVSKKRVVEIYEQMRGFFKDIKVMPSLSEMLQDRNFTNQLKTITIEDLLARHPKDLDKSAIGSFLKNKKVLVTGAGGSIGSEICRQCVKYGAKSIFALDHSEFNLYTLSEELGDEIIPYMVSVLNAKALQNIIFTCKPEIIIHAAAYKHVHLVECNMQEGIENNIIGTKNCIDIASKGGVEKFILISTDKAVRPTSVMGATKRVCELYAANKKTDTMEIITVRFGNVLGSSGSVIPKFKAQIQKGGPITVTHKDVTRYFMLISEACELVLQSASLGKGGEIFILDMGKPIKIIDLAKKMIELYGKDDISIKITSLRAGEKLYEELLISENDIKTKYPSIMVASNTFYDIEQLSKEIEDLFTCKDKIAKLKEIIPEFNHKPQF